MADEQKQTIKVEVTGAPESKGLLKGVLDTVKQLGAAGKKAGGEELKGLWDAFKEGKDAGNTLTGTLNVLKSTMSLNLIAFTGGVAVYTKYVLAAMQAADATVQMYKEIRQLQSVAGGTIEEVDALQDALTLMGIPSEMLTMAMFRLGSAIESDSLAIRRLGLDVRDTAGNLKEPIQVFMELRDRISQIGSEAERSAAMREVFGRQAARLSPVFKANTAEFAAYLQKAKELGDINDEIAEQTVGLLKAQGELELQQERYNALLAQQLGIPLKKWLAEVQAGIYGVINAMLAHDAALEKRREFGKKTGVLFGGFLAGWSTEVQEAVDAQKQAEDLEKKAAEVGREPTYTKERMKNDETLLKHDREMQSMRLKAAADAAAEEAKVGVGTSQAVAEARIRSIAEQVDSENANYEARLAIQRKFFKGQTDEQVMGQKEVQALTRDHEKKLLDLQIQGDKERRAMKQAEVKDAEVQLDRELKQRRTTSELSVKLVEAQEAQELATLSSSSDDKVTVAERSDRVREESARRTANTRMALLDQEISGWVRMAALYQDNAEVQIKANEKILEATSKRAMVEIDTNKKIVDDRKAMVEKLKQQEQEKAGVGATLEEKALSSLKKQGFKAISSQMVKAEASRLYQWGEYYAKEYERGGSLSPEALEYAREWQGVARKMRDVGEPGGGLSAPVVGQIYEGGAGRLIGSAERARGAAYGTRSDFSPGLSIADVGTTISEIPKQTKKALEDIKAMLAGEGQGGVNLANTIKDMIVRSLEFEAARQ